MTLAEILASLFPQGHAVAVRDGLVTGTGPFAGGQMHVVGVDGDTPLGVDGALVLSRISPRRSSWPTGPATRRSG